LIRLVTGASWVDIEAILDHQVSDTTLRTRRDEWIDAGVFDQVKVEALAAFDRIVGLDLDDVAVDGSLHKAPYGGEGTGPNPTDRAKLGWKWSVAAERHGIPVGWAIDGANRNDVRMLEPTLDAVSDVGLLDDIGVLHLDRSYDSPAVRDRLRAVGIDQFEIQRRGTKLPDVKRQPLRLGLRWVVEATNTWWSNYLPRPRRPQGQLERARGRQPRRAALLPRRLRHPRRHRRARPDHGRPGTPRPQRRPRHRPGVVDAARRGDHQLPLHR
jgi:hypothetical protein